MCVYLHIISYHADVSYSPFPHTFPLFIWNGKILVSPTETGAFVFLREGSELVLITCTFSRMKVVNETSSTPVYIILYITYDHSL